MEQTIYANFNGLGIFLGFWQATEEDDAPPQGGIEVTADQADDLMRNAGSRRLVNGVITEYVPVNMTYAGFDENGAVAGFWQSLAYPEGAVPPDGYVPISQDQFEEIFANQGLWRLVNGSIVPFEPPVPEPGPYRISKTTPWLRMTDAEAELISGAMQQASSRQRGIYDAASYLASDDPLWATLRGLIATTLNSMDRADELLAPEAS